MQNGRFEELFDVSSEFKSLGRGGFGSVVAARPRGSDSWCAVKAIPVRVKEGQAVESTEAWCGSEVFAKLQELKSPNVLQYYNCWAEDIDPLANIAEGSTCSGSPRAWSQRTRCSGPRLHERCCPPATHCS